MSIPDLGNGEDGPFGKERKTILNFKKAILLTAGAAVQKLMTRIEHEQELLMDIADMVIDTYIAESALLRAWKLVDQRGEGAAAFELDITRTYIYDAADRINKSGKDAINAFADGDEQRMLLLGLKRFTKVDSFNSKESRRRIAEKLIADNKYPL
jgi:hypothetical protein